MNRYHWKPTRQNAKRLSKRPIPISPSVMPVTTKAASVGPRNVPMLNVGEVKVLTGMMLQTERT